MRNQKKSSQRKISSGMRFNDVSRRKRVYSKGVLFEYFKGKEPQIGFGI